MKPFQQPRLALALMAALLAAGPAHAAITVLDYWHMGENDPGAVSGGHCTNTVDVVAGHTLTNTTALGLYPTYTNGISVAASAETGSTLALVLTNGQYGTGLLATNLTDNFGIECWVKPGTTSGGQVLAYNGLRGNGWGLYQSGAQFQVLYGGEIFFGSALATAGTWTHLALVRSGGVAILYTNGVPASTNSTTTPLTPTGSFTVGGDALFGEYFTGAIDEVRVFTFAPGAFSTNDLLLNSTNLLLVSNTNNSGAGSLRAAVAYAPNGATITFATNLSGQTIVLTNGEIVLSNNVTIDATALPNPVVISGNNASRVFRTAAGSSNVLTALVIVNGHNVGSPGQGGAIYNAGTLILNRDTIAASSAAGSAGTAALGGTGSAGTGDAGNGGTGGSITGGNGGAAQGGGIYNAGTLTLNDNTISSNTASGGSGGTGTGGTGGSGSVGTGFGGNGGMGGNGTGGAGGNGFGGGIYNAGTVILNQNTIAGNSTAGGTGGTGIGGAGGTAGSGNPLYGLGGNGGNGQGGNGGNGEGTGIYNTGTEILIQNTVYANSAAAGGFGSGQGGGGGFGRIGGSSGSGASGTSGATMGGGLFIFSGGVTLTNTIVASNTAASNPDISGAYTGISNLVGGNPMLAPLGNYGGPTQTMPPVPGSSVINAGSDSVTAFLATDQRGYPRLSGSHVDIGAVEFQCGLVVSSIADSGENTLRAAVAYNPSGSTITFATNLSGQTITLTNGEIDLSDVTIDASALTNGIAINGNASSRVFGVGGTVVLNALTITNAFSAFGGGMINYGTLTVKNCTFAGNQAANFSDGGGAMENWGGATMTVINSTFTGNQVPGSNNDGGGAIVDEGGTLTVINSTIVGNSAAGNYGGGIHCYGTLLMTNSIVCSNIAFASPNVSGVFSVSNNLVDANALLAPLGNYGGPTPTMPPLAGSPAIDSGIVIAGLTTDQRGHPRLSGAQVDIGAVEVNPNTIVTTTADNGVASSLRKVVANTTNTDLISFAPNLSGQTILLTNGQIELSNSVAIDASALANGIQINGNASSRVFQVNGGVTAVLDALTITNASSSFGGGMKNMGTLTVMDCTFANNHTSGDGGGIGNFGTLTVNQSTFYGNSAAGGGGGIEDNGLATVNQGTFYGNSATGGGGIDHNTGTLLTVNQSTFYGNTGAGIFIESGSLNLTNTIVSLNSGGDISGSVNSSVSNLVDRADINLAPLGNYGGRTLSMPPLPGSPAIDAGAATTLTTDQRGFPRVVGPAPDIGAVESGNAIPGFIPVVTTNSDAIYSIGAGAVSLREAVAFATGNAIITFATSMSGQTIVLTNGQITLSQADWIDGTALANGIQISGNHNSRIFNVGTNGATLVNLTLINANGGGDDGGALYNAGNTVLNYCTFTGNSTGSGGAIKNVSGSLVLDECTLAGNSTTGGGGGGIVNYATLFLNGCTLTGNSAGFFGGAVYSETGGHVTLNDTIAAGNTSVDIYNNGTLTLSGSNIVQSISGSSSGTTPINASPQLAALGNYGGPTPTMPPLPGSPAIDAGADSEVNFLPTDQRGYPRLAGAHVDIGAVEGIYVASSIGKLTGVTRLGNGSIQLGFTNLVDANFPVLATTNLSLPSASWPRIGFATNNPAGSGQYQFTDPQATNYPRRFYRVSSQ